MHHHTDGTADPSEPHVMDQAFWDERYRSAPQVWSGRPNPHLVSGATELAPGTALDVGCGEGADAIWLAEHGWTVTAVDISPVALDRGRRRAEELGAPVPDRITWVQADLASWVPPAGAFDLVSAQFLHVPSVQRGPLYRRFIDAVAPGGVVVLVGHHPDDLQTTARRPPSPDLYFTAEEVAAELGDDWTILTCDARPRPGTDQDGEPITLHDTVLAARRSG